MNIFKIPIFTIVYFEPHNLTYSLMIKDLSALKLYFEPHNLAYSLMIKDLSALKLYF